MKHTVFNSNPSGTEVLVGCLAVVVFSVLLLAATSMILGAIITWSWNLIAPLFNGPQLDIWQGVGIAALLVVLRSLISGVFRTKT